SNAEYLVIVTPAAFLHESLKPLKNIDLTGKKIITAVKGIIPETMQLISDYLHSEFNIPLSSMAMISGPSHAEEIAQEKYTFLTAISENVELAKPLPQCLPTDMSTQPPLAICSEPKSPS
ncbi:MAG: hypothetical protein IIU33_06405, partial [Bacteroidales bacterium]|nr:hypothetical protein [Bacteroidales bacterium]